jgi:pimeloyl-ACP methyl ester carboxylesterase
MTAIPYDEFSYLADNAADAGLFLDNEPRVARVSATLGDGRLISAIAWQLAPPELVLLHGGAQNAHTWDTTMLALQEPALCIDLPSHGHSGPPRKAAHDVVGNADDLAEAIAALAPAADTLVGMSLGGLTALAMLANHPLRFERLVLVDITPEPNPEAAKAIVDFVNGPANFASLDAMLERTMAFNPTRSESSLRRGILHNAVQLDDGSWVWRHRRGEFEAFAIDYHALWELAETITIPVLLCRGMNSGSVITDELEAEFLRRMPNARVQRFENAGHSIQGDAPLALADAIRSFHAATR